MKLFFCFFFLSDDEINGLSLFINHVFKFSSFFFSLSLFISYTFIADGYFFLDYSSIQSIEYMSSSEEQEALLSPNPFSTARRSKKYTSKKSYKDYLQSRPHNSENNKSKANNSIATTNGNGNSNSNGINNSMSNDFPNSDSNNNSIIGNRENLNGKEIGISKSTSCGGAAKFSLIMNDIHGIKQQKQQQSCDDTHSLRINRMHGISLTSLNVNERREMLNNNDDAGNMENGNQSAINTMDEIREQQYDAVAVTHKYCDDGLEVKQKIATRDDWYISDIEEADTMGGKPSYSNCTGVSNSVLECVNQILLQQSMDEFIETQNEKRSSFASNDSKDSQSVAPPTRSNKRVHFSTKNSMVQITPLPRTPPSDHHSDDMLNSTYENQSTYSNEYEPIGSSRTYVDMDTKSLDSYKPTLPPKPDNLMKLQQISKQRQFVQDQIYKPKNSDYELNESEPDYCSISEIQDNIKSVKIVKAEVHNNADDNEYSEIKEVPTPSPSDLGEDSFEDVPKLPNVYSIIPGFEPPTSPRKESPMKCIGHDNYITKSPMKKKSMSSSPSSILADINNVKKQSLPKATQQPPPAPPSSVPPLSLKTQQTIKIIDEKIQQEFDWYNLDVEYQSKTDVITTQIENIEEMYQFDDENLNDVMNGDESEVKVEYNLDFEFEQASAEGIEIETNNNNFTTVIKINESSSSNESSPPVNKTSKTTNLIELAETPKLDLKKKLNYEKFLSESGMLSKPLMARKKFYAGSFV